MHKQLLSTAFAAFLALAFVLGTISPMAEENEIVTQDTSAVTEYETIPDTSAKDGEETSTPITETEGDTVTETAPPPVEEERELLLPSLTENARPLSLYINGRATAEGFCFEEEGRVWLPLQGFGQLFDYEGISAKAGECYIISGDRAIPCSKNDANVTVIDRGVLCAPLEALLSAAGLRSTEIVGDEICIWGVPTFPSAEDVYGEEDLYWLSRIISAESRGEPFIGQLAVGTVVINRTGSKYYPDTIYGVIFDRVGGVQFTPAATGSVHRDPTESSVLAAKLCLEGFSLDPGILFFFNSKLAAGSWITANRTYTMTVGQHDFYS